MKDKRVSIHGTGTTLGTNFGTTFGAPNSRHSTDSDSVNENVQTFQRAALYVLGEKAQMKVCQFFFPFLLTIYFSFLK